MATRNDSPSAKQFLKGLAWTMLIVSAWACLRLSFMLMTISSSEDEPGGFFEFSKTTTLMFLSVHWVLAAFSIYAASALLRLTTWTRTYFVLLLALIGLEANGFGLVMALTRPSAAVPNEIGGMHIAVGVALCLIGATAVLVAWKLWTSKPVKGVFLRENG